MSNLFAGMTAPVESRVGAGLGRGCLIWLEATFATFVATVVSSSHPGVTMTRQGSTGIYDVVVPGCKKLIPLGTPVIFDTNDDPAATPIAARYGVKSDANGTIEAAFFEAEGEVDDVGPSDTQTVYMAFIGFAG